VPDVVIRREFGVSPMSIFRWERDPSLDFPRPVIIRGRRYFFRDQIKLFKDRLIAAGANGDPQTRAPARPFRRPKKPQRVGGVVT
jgi:hypothetical protein